MFEKSLTDGKISRGGIKDANVTAVFKQGARKKPENHRPVSITSQVGNVMENIIKKELVTYLERNGLICETQHGFRKNRSCLTNLLDFLKQWQGRWTKESQWMYFILILEKLLIGSHINGCY